MSGSTPTARRRTLQIGCAVLLGLILLAVAIARPAANVVVALGCVGLRGLDDPLLPYAERAAWSWAPYGRRLAVECLLYANQPEAFDITRELAETTPYPEVWAYLMLALAEQDTYPRPDLWDDVDLRSVTQRRAMTRAIRLERATERTEICEQGLTLDPYTVRAEAVECLAALDLETHVPALVRLARTEDDSEVRRQLVHALRESDAPGARTAWLDLVATLPNSVGGAATARASWMDDALFEVVETPNHIGQHRAVVELAERNPERLAAWCRHPLLRFRVDHGIDGADGVCREKVLLATQPATPPG